MYTNVLTGTPILCEEKKQILFWTFCFLFFRLQATQVEFGTMFDGLY